MFINQRDGIDELMNWIGTSDFYTAPASTRYHGSYPGGLLQHSLNVYDELKRVLSAYPEIKCEEESAVICALFHDFCKINYYSSEKRNRKNEFGQWESYDAFKVDEKFCYGSHGGKSVFLIQHFIKLTPEEAWRLIAIWELLITRMLGNLMNSFHLRLHCISQMRRLLI